MSESIIQHSLTDDTPLNRGMQALIRRWRHTLAAGNRRIGWKMAFVTKADQFRLQLSAPLVGFLTSDRLLSTGCVYTLKEGATTMVEAEIGIVLGHDVPPGTVREKASSAIEAFAPALELIDVTSPSSDIEEMIGGNLFHEAVAFGAEIPAMGNSSMREISARVLKNGVEACVGDPSRIPNDLGELVSLVADTLGQHGECLRKGDRIISGSITKQMRVSPADDVVVDLGALGQISIQFAAG